MLKAHVSNMNLLHAYSNHPKNNNKTKGGEGWANLGKESRHKYLVL